jgi:hypothetical protein
VVRSAKVKVFMPEAAGSAADQAAGENEACGSRENGGETPAG